MREMIYCVIPPELVDDLYERMVEYYKDNPNVEVIIDRRSRKSDDRTDEAKRSERRRLRIPGTFPEIDSSQSP
jgi:RNase adaptor protein for sRNA GlmZ degradation